MADVPSGRSLTPPQETKKETTASVVNVFDCTYGCRHPVQYRWNCTSRSGREAWCL
jgi:hypothetical protein